MRRFFIVAAALVGVALLAYFFWPSDAGGTGGDGAGEGGTAPLSANDGVLPATRVAPRWTQPVEQRGRRSLLGRVTRDGQGVPGATVTALAHHGEDVLSDLDCKCDNQCGRKLLECGCAEASGQLVELVAVRTGEGVPLARAQTDAEGKFALDGLDDTQLVVWADAPGGVGLKLGVRAGDAPFDLELGPGYTLAGSVRGGDEKPIAGALVTAISARHSRFFDALTDADGKFTLGPVPEGPVAVVAMRDGLLPDHEQVRDGAGRDLTLTLDAPRALGGVVRSGDEGVPGATVAVEGMHRKRKVTTDAQGAFRFERLRPGEYELTAEAPAGRGHTETRVPRLEDRTDVVLSLRRGADLRGVAVDESGAPVAEAKASVWDGASWRTATTAADGRFLVAALPPGEHRVSVSKRGFLEAKSPQVVLGEAGADVRVTLRRAAELAGKVVTEAGALVPEYTITARAPAAPKDGGASRESDFLMDADDDEDEGDQSSASASSTDGGFVLYVAPGPYELYVTAPPYAPAQARAVAPARGLVLTVQQGGRVTGEVLDGDGRPIAGAHVVAVQAPKEGAPATEGWYGRERSTATADERGRFELTGLPAGRHLVSAQLADRKRLRAIPAETVEVPYAGKVHVVLKAKRGQSISGKVLGADGKPVEGIRVVASQLQKPGKGVEGPMDGTSGMTMVPSERDGSFKLEGLDEGPATLMAVAEGGRRVSKEVTAPAANVVLQLGAATEVSGRVLGEGGRPLTSFRVNGRPVDAADGRFTLPAWKGLDKLAFDADGYAQHVVPLQIREGRNELGDVVMPRGRPLSGRVTDKETGAPVAGALVDVDISVPGKPLSRNFLLDESRGAVRTGADGRYRLERVDPRADLVAVTHDGHVPYMGPLAPGSGAMDIALEPGARLTVSVLGADGKPVSAVYVTATGPEQRMVVLTSTMPPAERGFFAGGLEPGQWVVAAAARDARVFRAQTVMLAGGSQTVTLREATTGADVDVTGADGVRMMMLVSGPKPATLTEAWLTEAMGREALHSPDGHFRLVSPGTWTLLLFKPRAGAAEVGAQQVEISAEARQTIRAAPTWTTLGRE